MDAGDPITGMAVHTQGSGCHLGAVVVAVTVKVCGMALRTGGAAEDSRDLWSVDRQFEIRWRGVTVRAFIGVHYKRAVGWMTDSNAGRVIQDDAGPSRRVIDRQVDCRGSLVHVTVQAINR